MLKMVALIGLFGAALALLSVPASAQTGTSSSWGSYGWGPQIPTQALTPFDREYNHDNEALNEAIAGSQWFREQSEPRQQPRFPPSP
jgi:hypothetical protein